MEPLDQAEVNLATARRNAQAAKQAKRDADKAYERAIEAVDHAWSELVSEMGVA